MNKALPRKTNFSSLMFSQEDWLIQNGYSTLLQNHQELYAAIGAVYNTPILLVRRALEMAGSGGLAPQEILDFAETPAEKLISLSIVQAVLLRGSREGWCHASGHKWVLPPRK
jgi:hypothetical protein